ncbi:CD209 antigen-like protein E [Erpetoichthys calabaricus]|uniref:CD209 antigen-like protein E n=1 Tax=Erpetoichthys calabaricus TaxID=27687 RepID=A0A8C4RKF2_ERPCA|nr:CD209 antigen-like protein E [Erpetoichthys calabaricus]
MSGELVYASVVFPENTKNGPTEPGQENTTYANVKLGGNPDLRKKDQNISVREEDTTYAAVKTGRNPHPEQKGDKYMRVSSVSLKEKKVSSRWIQFLLLVFSFILLVIIIIVLAIYLAQITQQIHDMTALQMKYLTLNESFTNVTTRYSEVGRLCAGHSVSAEWTCVFCPESWLKFEKKCYYISTNNQMSWDSSQDKCVSLGGHLVIIESTQEQKFLEKSTVKNMHYWIGLNNLATEGGWRWLNNKTLDGKITFWSTQYGKQPDNYNGAEHCVEASNHEDILDWNDITCGTQYMWICEKAAGILKS